jgi:hypothetical protein
MILGHVGFLSKLKFWGKKLFALVMTSIIYSEETLRSLLKSLLKPLLKRVTPLVGSRMLCKEGLERRVYASPTTKIT